MVVRFLTIIRTVTLAACAVTGATVGTWLLLHEAIHVVRLSADMGQAVRPVCVPLENGQFVVRLYPQRLEVVP